MSDEEVYVSPPFEPNPAHFGNIIIEYDFYDKRGKVRKSGKYRMWAENPLAARHRFLQRPYAYNHMCIITDAYYA